MAHDPQAAAELAERLVSPLGPRWKHVQAVAARAQELARGFPESDRNDLMSGAWLHDVGYSPAVVRTGFHPLDGANYLRAAGWPEGVVHLVAHHSGARFEAEERGLGDELAEFPFEDSALLDALVLADLTVGPAGETLTYDQRVSEILSRYPTADPVHRAWLGAKPTMAEAVERALRRSNSAQPR